MGIYTSSDVGNTWIQAISELGNLYIWCLLAHVNGNIFAGTYDGVYRSTDWGLSWQRSNQGISQQEILGLASDMEGNMYAGTSDKL